MGKVERFARRHDVDISNIDEHVLGKMVDAGVGEGKYAFQVFEGIRDAIAEGKVPRIRRKRDTQKEGAPFPPSYAKPNQAVATHQRPASTHERQAATHERQPAAHERHPSPPNQRRAESSSPTTTPPQQASKKSFKSPPVETPTGPSDRLQAQQRDRPQHQREAM
ncbi:hypothetical protein M427DRAFT_26764 [Gonapodya prolifera JEL478]|uniref:Uncharacterized protein n=1 Tax=Gonapodya prolifera (strain JEL478) TaxID=1344416 RepID=A0A139AZI8_GONPJ|nr:hypothetical protein M427DRAFT_26764 [Gonapodya prolifera JEL478]|eukprot:KXS22124.1 hypothetical protein M427DRAFT_26764 [Gonapodya prolifera JEL478]